MRFREGFAWLVAGALAFTTALGFLGWRHEHAAAETAKREFDGNLDLLREKASLFMSIAAERDQYKAPWEEERGKNSGK